MNGIKEFQQKGTHSVKGCHFVLMIIYFRERYDGKTLDDPEYPPPWIQRWCGERLKEKTNNEDVDISNEDSESTEPDTDSVSGEDEYHTMDTETEAESEEEQQERHSKKLEEESVIATNTASHMDIPVEKTVESVVAKAQEKEIAPEIYKMAEPAIQPRPQPQPEPVEKTVESVVANAQEKEIAPEINKMAKPAIQPGPQQQLEPIVTLGPEPPEVIDGYMAACEQAEKTSENKKKEVDAEIEACEEGEILLFLRRVVESVVVKAQEKEVYD
ncbi:hypothetical protein PIB30_050231 [Stylosanthes scabra]|uniref:Uncharacterized protein n=1 Tax=Stylosanthes scabra TaxID=79078 RepID=A0ABU6ZGC0_9FABA|nr:hypothetical protein [Stylosanthes scabra]